MIQPFPMTVLAQCDEVTVFQTSALAKVPLESLGGEKSHPLLHKGTASYGALNLGLHVDDEPSAVLNNRMRLLSAINDNLISQKRLPIKSLHWINQVHGQQIHDVDVSGLSMRPVAADAMVTMHSQKGLAIMTADCVPIVLYQPTTGKIAAIHAGWQGLACGVIPSTVADFSNSGQILAWIGVCISQANYEVNTQVRDTLLAGIIESQSLPASSIQDFNTLFSIISDSHADKINLDLPKLAHAQLVAAGVKVNNESPIACSYADPQYYSYRRQTHLQQPATGRMALIIVRTPLNVN